jgi:hypothetical protein
MQEHSKSNRHCSTATLDAASLSAIHGSSGGFPVEGPQLTTSHEVKSAGPRRIVAERVRIHVLPRRKLFDQEGLMFPLCCIDRAIRVPWIHA